MDGDIERRVGSLESRVGKLEDNLGVLREDVAEIKGHIAGLATKHDLTEAINGILQDALNSIPGRQVAVWTAITAVATVVGLAATIILGVLAAHLRG